MSTKAVYNRYIEKEGIWTSDEAKTGICMKIKGGVHVTEMFVTTSDERIKTNFTALKDGDSLDIINRLNPVRYII